MTRGGHPAGEPADAATLRPPAGAPDGLDRPGGPVRRDPTDGPARPGPGQVAGASDPTAKDVEGRAQELEATRQGAEERAPGGAPAMAAAREQIEAGAAGAARGIAAARLGAEERAPGGARGIAAGRGAHPMAAVLAQGTAGPVDRAATTGISLRFLAEPGGEVSPAVGPPPCVGPRKSGRSRGMTSGPGGLGRTPSGGPRSGRRRAVVVGDGLQGQRRRRRHRRSSRRPSPCAGTGGLRSSRARSELSSPRPPGPRRHRD